MALNVMDRTLNLRPREPSEHEEHPESGLHWRLGPGLGQVDNTPKPGDAFGSRMLSDICAQLGMGNPFGMKDHVRGDDSFCQWISASEDDDRSECRCGG